jgi:lysophospholipase L1-like esterase
VLLAAAGCTGGSVAAQPPTTVTLSPAPFVVPDDPPRLLVFGDSLVVGVGSTTPPSTSFGFDVGEQLGWPTATNGVSGTGYVNAGPQTGLDLTYGARLQALPAVALDADVILVEGGLNDRWQRTDVLAAAAKSFLELLRTKAPAAQIVVLGATAPAPDDPADVAASTEVNAVLSAVAGAEAVTFIDPVAENWFTTENVATYITSDRVHPTEVGHQYMAARLAEHLRQLAVG